jgi:hypothetical protein
VAAAVVEEYSIDERGVAAFRENEVEIAVAVEIAHAHVRRVFGGGLQQDGATEARRPRGPLGTDGCCGAEEHSQLTVRIGAEW